MIFENNLKGKSGKWWLKTVRDNFFIVFVWLAVILAASSVLPKVFSILILLAFGIFFVFAVVQEIFLRLKESRKKDRCSDAIRCCVAITCASLTPLLYSQNYRFSIIGLICGGFTMLIFFRSSLYVFWKNLKNKQAR